MTPRALVNRLLEADDIDWSPRPGDPDVPSDLSKYAYDSSLVSALEAAGYEQEDYWYLGLSVPHGRVPSRGEGFVTPNSIQVMVDPRQTEKFNDLSVWLYYNSPEGAVPLESKMLMSLHQREDGTDASFAKVVADMAHAAKRAATFKVTDYGSLNAYAKAVVDQFLAYVPPSYRDHTEGFLHYTGRVS